MKIKDGNFEMPCMELVTFSSEDVICTSGGALDIASQSVKMTAYRFVRVFAVM